MRPFTYAAAAAATLAVHAWAKSSRDNEVLIFEDTFDKFNLSVWKHEITLSGEGNWEFEYYLNNRTNSFARNGVLNIMPSFLNNTINIQNADLNIWGGDPANACTDNAFFGCERTGGAGGNIVNPIQSARLRTAESFAFKYGRVEVVAKLPRGDWLWPAIWMMPVQAAYGSWPASGEVDIMESRGNARGYGPGGVESFSSTLHWGPYWPDDGYTATHASYTLPPAQGQDLSVAFHTYGLLWNETTLMTYIDDDVTGVVLHVDLTQPPPGAGSGNVSNWFWTAGGWANNSEIANPWQDAGYNAPFDQRFYLIMNLAAGGTNGYFPDGPGTPCAACGPNGTPGNATKPWVNTNGNAMDQFWGGVNQWAPTWPSCAGGAAAGSTGSPFQIDSVRVWQQAGSTDYSLRPGM